jgi:hypothetical protein
VLQLKQTERFGRGEIIIKGSSVKTFHTPLIAHLQCRLALLQLGRVPLLGTTFALQLKQMAHCGHGGEMAPGS